MKDRWARATRVPWVIYDAKRETCDNLMANTHFTYHGIGDWWTTYLPALRTHGRPTGKSWAALGFTVGIYSVHMDPK